MWVVIFYELTKKLHRITINLHKIILGLQIIYIVLNSQDFVRFAIPVSSECSNEWDLDILMELTIQQNRLPTK